jgi:hypothetical protein
MMDGKKIGCRIADNQDGAVRQLGEHNFRSMSLPREIRMVAPVWVIKFEFDSNLGLEKLVFICLCEKLENCLQCGQSPKLS